MKAKCAVVCGVLLMFASLGWTMNPDTVISICMYDDQVMLTTTPHGHVPASDGTTIGLFHDANSNGPDSADSLVLECYDPPTCMTGGPMGSFNFNTFAMNGELMGLGAGYFYTDPCFYPIGMYPQPDRFYLRVMHPAIRWNSEVMIFVSGPNDYELNSWTASPSPDLCSPPSTLTVLPVPSPQHAVIDTCLCLSGFAPNGIHMLEVGPFPSHCITQYPSGIAGPLTVTLGCPGSSCVPSTAAEFTADWEWVTVDGQYYERTEIALPVDSIGGCVHVQLNYIAGFPDCWLPITLGSFAAQPLDNAVKLTWNTLSETNASHFDILRDNASVHSEAATNTPVEHVYAFTDHSVLNGTVYRYQLRLVNANGSSTILAALSAMPSAGNAVITEYALHQNYPNPFNPSTTIRFDLPAESNVSLKVFNLMGQEIASPANGYLPAGRHSVSFDASSLPSGVYLYRLSVNNFVAEKKMLLMK